MKTLKNLSTLKSERIIVELDKTAQKSIIGGINAGLTDESSKKINLGTYFDVEYIEE